MCRGCVDTTSCDGVTHRLQYAVRTSRPDCLAHSRTRKRGTWRKPLLVHGQAIPATDTVPDPQDRATDRRRHQDHLHRHLRLGPASPRRLHADHGDRRRPRPRADGRRRRGRKRRSPSLKKGDRVVVPFTISCGTCFFCQKTLFSRCDNSNPNAKIAAAAMGHSPAGLFGFSHMLGGYAGGQAEYLRVPYADVGPLKIESGPAGREGAVPLGHLPDRLHGRRERRASSRATRSPCGAAGRSPSSRSRAARGCSGRAGVIAIDRVPERLEMAEAREGRDDQLRQGVVYDTAPGDDQGRGPDRCIDAVGCEAHAAGTIDAVAGQGEGARSDGGTDRRTSCARRSCAAARGARSRSRASTSGSRTRSRSGRS